MEAVSGGHAEPGTVITLPPSAVPSASGLKAGTVLKAEVMDYIASGMVSLKVIIPTGRTEGQAAMQDKLLLNVMSQIPMPKGQTVFLEVAEGDGGGIVLKFLGLARGTEPSATALQGQARQMLAGLANSRVSSAEMSQMMNTLKSLPPQVREALPELAALERVLPGMAKLDAATLRSAVDGSGILYEAKVKLAVLQGLSGAQGTSSSGPAVEGSLQRFAQASSSPAVDQAFRALGLGGQHIELLGRVLQGGAQVGDDTLSAMIKTISNPSVSSALKASGVSGVDVELVINLLAGKLGSSGGGLAADSIASALRSLSEGPHSGVLPRLIESLGNPGVIGALKAQGITEPEIAVLINALGGRSQISQTALAGIMQMQAGQMRKGLIQRFAESAETPGVSSSLKSAGLTDAEVGVIARLLSGRAMAPESMMASFARLAQKDDLKETLLRLSDRLGHGETVKLLREGGYEAGEIRAGVDKALGNIEFFQLSSRVENMLRMFLPVAWDGLKDGELVFSKREERGGKPSYSCDITLDMNPLGNIAFSVTSYEGTMYLSLMAERPETEASIRDARGELTQGLLAQGLRVSAMNIGQRRGMQPGDVQERGINIKV